MVSKITYAAATPKYKSLVVFTKTRYSTIKHNFTTMRFDNNSFLPKLLINLLPIIL